MDFTKICRLCCKEKRDLRLILDNDPSCSLKDIFCNILQIEVYSDDRMPQKVCKQCSTAIVEVNQTIETFRENDLMLRQQIFSESPMKEEVDEIKIEMLLDPEVEEELDLEQDFVEEEAEDHDAPQPMADDDEDYIPSPLEEQDEKESEVPVKRKRASPKKPRKPRDPNRREQKDVFGRRIRNKPKMPRPNDFICYICKSEPHESHEALFSHLHVMHKDDVPYTCQACEFETVVIDCVTTLNVHKKMHEMPCKCPHCDRRFSCNGAVVEHIKRTHDTETGSFKCPQCDKEYPTKSGLDTHIYSHQIRIPCDICGRMYSNKSKLRVHIERKHTPNAKKVECPICGKLLQSLDSVRTHISIMHSKAEPIPCPHCPKSFVSKNSLQYHVKKHEANPNKKCLKDWSSYYSYADPADADKRHNDRMKKCNLCDIIVRNISSHMVKKHFPEEFPCTLCDEVFKDNKSLEVHLFEHSEGKFLICPICDREFRNRKNLMAHLQTKKHRDHPLAQSLEWLDARYPGGRVGKNGETKTDAVEVIL